MRTILMTLALTLTPSIAGAQEDAARWLPWIGCWHSSVERPTGDGFCIVPVENGVKMLAVTGDQISTVQTIVADGLTHEIVEPPCTGERRADWSRRANLLFTAAEITCESGPRQKLTGLHLFTSGPTWVDIEAVEAAGRENVRAGRYERMSVPASVADLLPQELIARATAATERLGKEPLTVDDIIEANRVATPVVIEAALFETKTRFALNSRSLVALKDAGLEEPVIDLMLAISYPERFAINRWASVPFAADLFPETEWAFSRPYRARHDYSGFYSTFGPIWFDPGWDLRHFRDGDSPTPAHSFGISAPPQNLIWAAPNKTAQPRTASAVNGQGYTRGQPPASGSNDSSSSSSTNTAASSRARSVVRAPASSSSSGSDGGGSSSGSSGSSASSGGYSSGSSGGGGRTAVDRD